MKAAVDVREIDEILQKYQYEPSSIIAILQDTQAKYRYLPRNMLQKKKLKIKERENGIRAFTSK